MGAGLADIDPASEDMLDAALLLSPTDGQPWWRPTGIDDLDRTPYRLLTLFRAMREGYGARTSPYVWLRPGGKGAGRAHHYRRTFSGVPEAPASCGLPLDPFLAGDVTEWEDTGGDFACAACRRVAGGGEGTGSINPTREHEVIR